MKTKLFLLSLCLFLVANIGFAQKKADEPRSIINGKIAIKKYYNKEELERLQKGELLTLYTERIEALVETLPYIAFATKPGVTMAALGIPHDKENSKILDAKFEATSAFLTSNKGFQNKILPYSDTTKLISAIMFYEEILKSLHEYSEFH